MKKLLILALTAAAIMPAYALNLDSDSNPCVKHLKVKKGDVYQVSAYDYEYLQLSDNATFDIKDSQGKRLTPTYQREVKAYMVFVPDSAQSPNTLYLTANKTGSVSSVCLYSGL